ncbi:MAG: XdhC family protein [Cytophagales bacterium]|nr:XdhC family protein [Cytophagales bacterium]
MKEIKTILEQLRTASQSGVKTVLATVVNVHGSSYRRTGARMLILENGFWFGSVSGGCLEGDVIEKAKTVLKTKKAELFRYDTRQNAKNSFGMGYGCNGLLEILIEPISCHENNPAYTILKQIASQPNLQGLSTVFYSDSNEIAEIGAQYHINTPGFISHNELLGHLVKDLEQAVKSGASKSKTYKIAGKKIKVFHEVFEPNINILIYGAVFHAVPFLRIARELGYNVHVTDSFEPIQPIWNFPHADEIKLLESEEADRVIENTSHLAVVFLTHNFFYIKEELPKALRSDVPYIGILGSRKKTQKILREAEVNDINYSKSELEKIHYPIGLDIGANTPEEIALSIVAEIKAFFAKRSGESLKKFDGYIHKKNLETV